MRPIEIGAQNNYDRSGPQGSHDRRRHARDVVALDAELVDRQSGKRIRGVTANISTGGCFIQSPDPLAHGRSVQLALAFGKRRFQCSAMVAHLCVGIGMGLSFPEFNALDWLTHPHKPTG